MPGKLYHVVPRTLYDFSGLPAAGVANLTVAKGIDVSNFRWADVVLRIHSTNIASGSPTIQLNFYSEAPTPEDPGQEFIFTSPNASSLGPITLSSTFATPFMSNVALTGPFGESVRVVLAGTQGASSVTFQVWISVDVVAKS